MHRVLSAACLLGTLGFLALRSGGILSRSLRDSSAALEQSTQFTQFAHGRKPLFPENDDFEHSDSIDADYEEESKGANYYGGSVRGNQPIRAKEPTNIPKQKSEANTQTEQSTQTAQTPTNTNTQIETVDALIIGAGWAGLSATNTLLNLNISNILVLEANDYIGGRSKSINSDGSINVPHIPHNPHNPQNDPNKSHASNVPIDLGSEWLFIEDNDMEPFLKQYHMIEGAFTDEKAEAFFMSLPSSRFYLQERMDGGSDGNGRNRGYETITTRDLSDEEAEELRERVWNGFLEFRENYEYEVDDDGADISYYDAAEEYKSKYLHSTPTSSLDRRYLDAILSVGEIDYTAPARDMSFEGHSFFDGHHDCYTHYVSVPGLGYGNIAASFALPFEGRVRLNSRVVEIEYRNEENENSETDADGVDSDSSYAIVTYIDPHGIPQKIRAKTVLVTASLGVLKSNMLRFNPPLPDWKQEVINEMGFGVLNKCAMQWNDPEAMVWPNDVHWFELITAEDTKDERYEGAGKWTMFFNPTKFKGIPTLVGWIGGKEAREVEHQTDEEILTNVMTHLTAMFPGIAPPDRTIITRWGSTENIWGTYSFKTVGRSFSSDSKLLKKPVGNQLWFAGEATAGSHWYGTTIGGWKSGREAAVGMAEVVKSWKDGKEWRDRVETRDDE